jgi:hypothetical protein
LHVLILQKQQNTTINEIIKEFKRFRAYEIVKRLKQLNRIDILEKLSTRDKYKAKTKRSKP